MSELLASPDNTVATALQCLGAALQLDRERSPDNFATVVDELHITIHEMLLDEYTHEEAGFIFRVWHDKFVQRPEA